MKSVTLRLSTEELEFLRKVKEVGFSSIAEVIRCAALSLVSSKPTEKKTA
jgi:hypothetical protein